MEKVDFKISIPFYAEKGYNSNEWKRICHSNFALCKCNQQMQNTKYFILNSRHLHW